MSEPNPVVILPVRPIAEAPRDGREVILHADGESAGGFWDDMPGSYRAEVGWFWESDRGASNPKNAQGVTHFSPLPDLSAPADPEAHAAVLRAQGWVCSPPVGEALPELAVGQVWVSPDLMAEQCALTITERRDDGLWRFTSPLFPHSVQSCTAADFLAWARRTNARPRS